MRPDPFSSKTGLPAPCSPRRARKRSRSRPRVMPWCDARGSRRPRSQASEFVGPEDADVDADPRRKNNPRLSEKWKRKGAASGVSVPRTRESERGPRGTPFKGGGDACRIVVDDSCVACFVKKNEIRAQRPPLRGKPRNAIPREDSRARLGWTLGGAKVRTRVGRSVAWARIFRSSRGGGSSAQGGGGSRSSQRRGRSPHMRK